MSNLDSGFVFPKKGSKASTPTFDFGSISASSSAKKDELTARQMAILLMEKNRNKDFSLGGALKGIGKQALNPVLWTFDKLLRPNYAVASGVDRGISAPGGGFDIGAALKGAWEGFSGERKMGFGEVLDKHGILEGHGRLRGVAGFGLDVVTDPLMLLSTAAAPITGGGSVAAYTAAKSAAKAAGTQVSKKVAKDAAYDAGRMALKTQASRDAEEVLALAGSDFKYRHALSKLVNEVAEQEQMLKDAGLAVGSTVRKSPAVQAKMNMLVASAFAEESRVTRKALQFQFGLPRKRVPITPTTIAGVRVAPQLPKLAKIASASIPLVSKLTDKTGKAFIPGFGRDELHALEINRTHLAEQMHLWNKEVATKTIGNSAKNLSDEQQMEILHLFEKPLDGVKAVVKDGEGYVLNEDYISALKAAGQLDDEAETFVRNWHDVMEQFNRQDTAIGLQYEHMGSKGKLYVPHMYSRGDDEFYSAKQWSILSEAGFTKKRHGDLSVLEIKRLLDNGNFKQTGLQIETKPLNLLVHTSRARAEKYADQAVVNSLADTFGVSTRTVNEAKILEHSKASEEAATRLEGAVRQAAKAEETYQAKFDMLYDDIERSYNTRIANAQKKIRQIRFAKNKKETFDQAGYDDAIRRLGRRTKDKARNIGKAKRPPYAWRKVKGRYVSPDGKFQIIKGTARDGKVQYTVRDSKGKLLKGGTHSNLNDAKAFVTGIDDLEFRKGLLDQLKQNVEREAMQIRIDHTKVVDVGRSKKGTISRLEKHIESLKAKRDAELALVVQKKHPKLKIKEEQLAIKTAKQTVNEARRDVKKLEKQYKDLAKGKPNRAFDDKTMREVGLKDEYGNPMALPADAADVLNRLEKVLVNDDRTLNALARGYAKYLSLWKLFVTSVNPGYRVRNTLTDFWNMYLMGVPIHQIGVQGVKAGNLMKTIKSMDLEDPKVLAAWDEIMDAATHGVLSGLYAGDIQSVAQAIRYEGSKRSLKKKPVRLFIKVMQDINRSAENWGRLTHYMYRRNVLKEGVGEAAMKVKIAHFDYEDLTSVEQKWMKRIFPFYTWTRKNVPYQLRQLAAEPGRYSVFPKAAMESEYAAGGPEGEVPGYLSDAFAFKVPFGDNMHYTPQLGMADLAMFQSPENAVGRVAGMVSPAAKVPAELLLNRNTLTGQEIDNDYHTRAPVTPLGAALLSLIPGSNVGTTERQGVSGPGANPYYQHILGLTPMTRQAFVSAGGIKGEQNPLAKWSWIAGTSLSEVDRDKQAEFTARELERKYQKWMAGLRDEGRVPRPPRKKSDFDKALEAQIKGG